MNGYEEKQGNASSRLLAKLCDLVTGLLATRELFDRGVDAREATQLVFGHIQQALTLQIELAVQ